MKIKIQHLEHFVLVAKHKGYRNASKYAFRTQAALSISIKTLEDILGKELFTKGNKTQLTKFGKLCLPKVISMLEKHQKLEDYMIDIAQGNVGTIRIGCIPSAVQHILPKILPNFIKKNPEIKTALTDNNSYNLYQKLLNDKIDIAISTKLKDLDKSIKFIPIHTDRLGVLCHKDILLARKEVIEFDDMKNYPFISNNISLFMNNIEVDFLNKNAIHYVENILSLNTAIQLNLGITILGKMGLYENSKDLVWIPLQGNINRDIGLMYIDTGDINPIIEKFISYTNNIVL